MHSSLSRSGAVLLAAALLAGSTPQATPAGLQVDGDLPRGATLTIADLEKLGPEDVIWEHGGTKRKYRGVALHAVLSHLGFAVGPMGKEVPPPEKCPGFRKALIATAPDGFTALFTAGELWPALGKTRAYVVWSVDGRPLGSDEGPLRIIVPTDALGTRGVHHVARLRVIDPTR